MQSGLVEMSAKLKTIEFAGKVMIKESKTKSLNKCRASVFRGRGISVSDAEFTIIVSVFFFLFFFFFVYFFFFFF